MQRKRIIYCGPPQPIQEPYLQWPEEKIKQSLLAKMQGMRSNVNFSQR